MLKMLIAASNMLATMSGSWKGGASRRYLLNHLTDRGFSAAAAELLVAPAADLTAKRLARQSRQAGHAASCIAMMQDFWGWTIPNPSAIVEIAEEMERSGKAPSHSISDPSPTSAEVN